MILASSFFTLSFTSEVVAHTFDTKECFTTRFCSNRLDIQLNCSLPPLTEALPYKRPSVFEQYLALSFFITTSTTTIDTNVKFALAFIGFIDRLKALVPSFATRHEPEDQQQSTNNDQDLMPDSSTQTPKRWHNDPAPLDNQRFSSRPPTRGKMAADMDPREHDECWAIINKWANYKDEEEEERERIENEIGMRLIEDGVEDDETMAEDICPTPGSGNGGLDDVSPLFLNSISGDVVMQDSSDQELNASDSEISVPPTPFGAPVEDVSLESVSLIAHQDGNRSVGLPRPRYRRRHNLATITR